MEEPSGFSVALSDGNNLAAYSLGAPTAPVVVLVHGFSLDHTTWLPVAERLVDAGHRVVLVDQRGHGATALGSAVPSVDQLVDDLARVLDTLEVAQVDLVGHSLGAVVALAARTDVRTASSLRSVTLVSGTERSIQNPVMRLGVKIFNSAQVRRLLATERLGRLLIASWFGRKPSSHLLDSTRQLVAGCSAETSARFIAATGDVDLRHTLPEPGPAALVICGSRDRATPANVSKRLAAGIPDATLRLIDGAGHMVLLERPDEVASAIAEHTRP